MFAMVGQFSTRRMRTSLTIDLNHLFFRTYCYQTNIKKSKLLYNFVCSVFASKKGCSFVITMSRRMQFSHSLLKLNKLIIFKTYLSTLLFAHKNYNKKISLTLFLQSNIHSESKSQKLTYSPLFYNALFVGLCQRLVHEW